MQISDAVFGSLSAPCRTLRLPPLYTHNAAQQRHDAPALLSAMDVFAMPSRSEGFSRAISEAMEAGLCVVATSVGGTPELIRHEIDGLTVPANDSAALANAIRRVATNPPLRRSLAGAGTERLRTEFTVDQMGGKIMAMFRSVASTPEAWSGRAA